MHPSDIYRFGLQTTEIGFAFETAGHKVGQPIMSMSVPEAPLKGPLTLMLTGVARNSLKTPLLSNLFTPRFKRGVWPETPIWAHDLHMPAISHLALVFSHLRLVLTELWW